MSSRVTSLLHDSGCPCPLIAFRVRDLSDQVKFVPIRDACLYARDPPHGNWNGFNNR